MRALLTLLMVLAMLGVVVILAVGVVGLVRDKGANPHRQNALMRLADPAAGVGDRVVSVDFDDVQELKARGSALDPLGAGAPRPA